MPLPLFATLSNVAYLMGGLFDFVLSVLVLIVALRSVRRFDAGLGMAIAAVAAARFFLTVASRSLAAVFNPIPFNDMNGIIPMVLTLFRFAIPLLELALWGMVLLALSRFASRLAR